MVVKSPSHTFFIWQVFRIFGVRDQRCDVQKSVGIGRCCPELTAEFADPHSLACAWGFRLMGFIWLSATMPVKSCAYAVRSFTNYRMSFAIDKSRAMKRGRSHQVLTTNLRVANGECVLGARIARVFCRNAKSGVNRNRFFLGAEWIQLGCLSVRAF